jgi:hypothetical protein
MTKADSVLSTPPTNTSAIDQPMFPPRDPTRRRFLAVAAVASAVSAGTLAAATAMDPSVPAAVTIPRHSTPDPAFALIDAKRAADIRRPGRSNSRNAPDRLGPSHDRSKPGPGTLRADTSRHRSPRLKPSVRHGTVDDVPLNSFALRASKSSQVLTRRARLNRHQLHRRTASRALWTLVLSVEHGITSVRCSEFSAKPSGRLRFEGVRCNDG